MRNLLILLIVPLILTSKSSMLRDIVLLDENTIFVVGDSGTILRTTDAGTTWEDISIETSSFMEIQSCSNKLWARTHLSNKIFFSNDLGDSWVEIYQLEDNYILNMAFLNDSLGFMSVGVYKLYKTTNGGYNWEQIEGSYYSAGPIEFIDEFNGWLGGFNGIYSTSDGGNIWNRKGMDTYELDIQEIHLLNEDFGFAVGGGYSNNNVYYGLFASSDDGGNNWSYKGFSSVVQDVHFLNPDTGYVISGNQVLQTVDKGINWDTTKATIYKFEFSQNKSWGLTFDGKVLFSEDGWDSWIQQYPKTSSVSDELVFSYSLSQNYPNPFNPTTKINYSISESGEVSIALYDILGKHISTLINEFKQPGHYSLEIDASNLSSGVYFYKMLINDYSATKKLLLIK